jgi:streptogramin lyase
LSELALGVGQGSVFISRDAAGRIDPTVMPDAIETPRDNATNNRVIISSLTGRSRILKPVLR